MHDMEESFGPLVREFLAEHPSWVPKIPSSCPPGWDHLVATTLEAMRLEALRARQTVSIAQIKEKFAELRIYFDVAGLPPTITVDIHGAHTEDGRTTFRLPEETPASPRQAFQGIVDCATERSRAMCQICGRPGRHSGSGWLRVVCPAHQGARA